MLLWNEFVLALTSWRENRGGGTRGMQSVINVVMNRSKRDGTSPYAECVRRLQFSSLTAPGDPELTLWPLEADATFLEATNLAQAALDGKLEDITDGAVDYFALTMKKPPEWAAKLTQTAVIEGQAFFREG